MGEEVCVTVTPDPGYEITSVSANGGEITLTPSETETGVYSFKMPADNVTLSATFTKVPFSVTTSAELGTLMADVQSAVVGDTVTLTLAPQEASDILGSLSVRSDGADVPTTKINDTTYTFTMPAGDVTANAVFVSYYCVLFENWDGEVLGWNDLYTNQTPSYTGETPVREATEMYSFTFAGWDKEIVPVSGDSPYITYTATYTATPRSYEIKFVGANDVVLQSDTLEYGATPSYTGETPKKATDDKYVYTFAGWDKPIATVTGEATYTATFSTVPVVHVGLNSIKLESYMTQVNPFTPEESGYYRFYTLGDEVHESFVITDSAGDAVEFVSGGYNPERNFHFEYVAYLEAGETYDLTFNSYSRMGTITLSVRKVDMYTVHFDQNIPHGTVWDSSEPTFMAYNGEKFYPYATPDDGYGLVELTVTNASGKRLLAEADGGYFMPASDVYVTATFGTAYTVDCDAVDYQVWWNNNEVVFDDWTSEDNIMVKRAAAGVNVEFNFYWEAGYILDEFSITTASGEEVEYGSFRQYLNKLEVWFTMPDEEVTVTANVAKAHDLTILPGEMSGTVYKSTVKSGTQVVLPSCPFDAQDKEFAGWSVSVGDGDAILMAPGEKVTMTADTTATATFTQKPDTVYTTQNGTDIDLTAAFTRDAEDKAKFGIGNTFKNFEILGVQKKSDENERAVRFVAVMNNSVVQDAEDYGFIAVEGDDMDDARAKIANVTLDNAPQENVFTCKGTGNSVSGNYGKYDSETDYKYVTLAINNIEDKGVAVMFYVKDKNDNVYYAPYTNKNGDSFNNCAVDWETLINNQ